MALQRDLKPYVIDTLAKLKDVLVDLGDCTGRRPKLYVSIEGHVHRGSQQLSLITILVEPAGKFFLIDITSLGRDGFTTASPNGSTLQNILESPDILKVAFDICDASEALFCLYDVRVNGLQDLQLMELAARTSSRKYTMAWETCIERSTDIPDADMDRWLTVKESWRSIVSSSRNDPCDILDQRPMSTSLVEHCVHNVLYMPFLWDSYRAKLCNAWWEKVEQETRQRIRFSQHPDYRSRREVMGLGPASWLLRNRRPSAR